MDCNRLLAQSTYMTIFSEEDRLDICCRIKSSHFHTGQCVSSSFIYSVCSGALTFSHPVSSGAAHSCCHSVICTLCIDRSHSSRAQSYCDPGSCAGGLCHLLVPLLHLLHLHGHKGKDKPA